QDATDVAGARSLIVLDEPIREVCDERDLLGPARQLSKPLATDVVRDLDQPVAGLARALTGAERSERVHKRHLRDVLRIARVAENREGISVHIRGMPTVKTLECAVSACSRCH